MPHFALVLMVALEMAWLQAPKKRRGTNTKPRTLRATIVAGKNQSFVGLVVREKQESRLANNIENGGAISFPRGWSDSNNKPKRSGVHQYAAETAQIR